jgi:hypothetical protein
MPIKLRLVDLPPRRIDASESELTIARRGKMDRRCFASGFGQGIRMIWGNECVQAARGNLMDETSMANRFSRRGLFGGEVSFAQAEVL